MKAIIPQGHFEALSIASTEQSHLLSSIGLINLKSLCKYTVPHQAFP